MAVTDTSPDIELRVAAHHAALTPLERLEIASSMHQTALAIIESSLPPGLTRFQVFFQFGVLLAEHLQADESMQRFDSV